MVGRVRGVGGGGEDGAVGLEVSLFEDGVEASGGGGGVDWWGEGEACDEERGEDANDAGC